MQGYAIACTPSRLCESRRHEIQSRIAYAMNQLLSVFKVQTTKWLWAWDSIKARVPRESLWESLGVGLLDLERSTDMVENFVLHFFLRSQNVIVAVEVVEQNGYLVAYAVGIQQVTAGHP